MLTLIWCPFHLHATFRSRGRLSYQQAIPVPSLCLDSGIVSSVLDLAFPQRPTHRIGPRGFSIQHKICTTFSIAVSRCIGTAMICFARMSSAVLDRFASCVPARSVERKCYSVEQKDSLRPLLKAIVYSRSWVKNSVKRLQRVF